MTPVVDGDRLYPDSGCEMIAAASQGGKRVGYVRVSSLDQNELRQLDGIELNKTFMDKASGKDTKPASTPGLP